MRSLSTKGKGKEKGKRKGKGGEGEKRWKGRRRKVRTHPGHRRRSPIAAPTAQTYPLQKIYKYFIYLYQKEKKRKGEGGERKGGENERGKESLITSKERKTHAAPELLRERKGKGKEKKRRIHLRRERRRRRRGRRRRRRRGDQQGQRA